MSPDRECRQLLARLELISHTPAVSLDREGKTGGKPLGGDRPPGGIDARDDFDLDYTLKSHVYYRRRYGRCRTDWQLTALAAEMAAVLEAWLHSPKPPRDSNAWREAVATDTRGLSAIAREYNLTRQQVYAIQQAYRKRGVA